MGSPSTPRAQRGQSIRTRPSSATLKHCTTTTGAVVTVARGNVTVCVTVGPGVTRVTVRGEAVTVPGAGAGRTTSRVTVGAEVGAATGRGEAVGACVGRVAVALGEPVTVTVGPGMVRT